jgi:hypothetical protein
MIHNKRRKNLAMLLLIAAFLLQANPLYIASIYLLYFLRNTLKCLCGNYLNDEETCDHKTIQKLNMEASTPSPETQAKVFSYRPESMEAFSSEVLKGSAGSLSTPVTVDVVLIGNDLSTLYTAGILSQAGMKCIIFEPSNTQAVKISPQNSELPEAFLYNLSTGDPMRTQSLFDKVLHIQGASASATSEQEGQQRVVLKPIGSAADGFAHTIINLKNVTKKNRKDDIVILRPGEVKLGIDKIMFALGHACQCVIGYQFIVFYLRYCEYLILSYSLFNASFFILLLTCAANTTGKHL